MPNRLAEAGKPQIHEPKHPTLASAAADQPVIRGPHVSMEAPIATWADW